MTNGNDIDDVSRFQELFLQTANGHILKMSSLLNQITEDSSKSLIEDLHLHAHSLKGEAFAMQYIQFGTYVTVIEIYVKNIKESNGTITEEKINYLRSAIQEMSKILEIIHNNQKEPDDLSIETETLQNRLSNTL